MINDTCPVCEVGITQDHVYSSEVKHRGGVVFVEGLVCLKCQDCDEVSFEPEHIRANQKLIAEARRQATDLETSDQTLKSDEIRAIRTHLGLTQAEAGRLFGGGVNAFSRYERGDIVPHKSTNLLLVAATVVPGMSTYLENLNCSHKNLLPDDLGMLAWSSHCTRTGWPNSLKVIREISDFSFDGDHDWKNHSVVALG